MPLFSFFSAVQCQSVRDGRNRGVPRHTLIFLSYVRPPGVHLHHHRLPWLRGGDPGTVVLPDQPGVHSAARSGLCRCLDSPVFFPKVKKVNLSKEESLTILGLGGDGPELLANETLMSEGQVIRSSTNQVQVYYRSLQPTNHGVFSLHYQGTVILLCRICIRLVLLPR